MHSLQCMEIWASNDEGEQSAGTPGIRAHVLSRPYLGAKAGGDIHYVSLCGGGVITRAVLADVAGHGEAVAMVARELRGIVRKNINNPSQKKLVGALNEQFGAMHKSSVFATAVVATYLANRDVVTFCNAGHPRPLIYRARTKTWELLPGEVDEADGNLPLGIDPTCPFGQFAVRVEPGDLVVLYTDHLIEARDAGEKALGEAGLLGLAQQAEGRGAKEAMQQIIEKVEAYRAGPADDDVTLLGLECTADKRHPWRLGERVNVYAKVFGLKAV